MISVDTKKKELVGHYKNGGREWLPHGRAGAGQGARLPRPSTLGKANPYGVYDVAANTGWVTGRHRPRHRRVRGGTRSRPGGARPGAAAYPDAARLLITADGGGSNGYRTRLWKTELARLAADTGLTITVCHLPPGTSKWNKSA